jgi:hypothetical protein
LHSGGWVRLLAGRRTRRGCAGGFGQGLLRVLIEIFTPGSDSFSRAEVGLWECGKAPEVQCTA